MTPGEMWDVLVEHCQANPLGKAEFEAYILSDIAEGRKLEYRFQGMLGFGGKVWVKSGETPYVTCYPEDLTDEREAAIYKANDALRKLSGVVEIKPIPLTVLLSKHTGAGNIMKCSLGSREFYLRENLKDGKQVLEIAAPGNLKELMDVVHIEDSLRREVVVSPEFTQEAAQAILGA